MVFCSIISPLYDEIHETFPFTEKEKLETRSLLTASLDDRDRNGWMAISRTCRGSRSRYAILTRRDDDQLPLKLFAIDSWRGKRKVPWRRKNRLEPDRKIEFLPRLFYKRKYWGTFTGNANPCTTQSKEMKFILNKFRRIAKYFCIFAQKLKYRNIS